MTVILLTIAVLALLVIAVAVAVAAVVVIVAVKKGRLHQLISGSPIAGEIAEIKESPGSDLVLSKLDGLSDQLGKIMEILVQILEEEQKGNAWIESQMSELGVGPGAKSPRTAAAARRAPRKRKLLGAGSPAGED